MRERRNAKHTPTITGSKRSGTRTRAEAIGAVMRLCFAGAIITRINLPFGPIASLAKHS
jgi:hypothetical protein